MKRLPTLRACAHAATAGAAAARRWRGVLVLLVLAVAWLALNPRPPEALTTGWDKLNHVLAFAALALSGRLGLPGARRLSPLMLGLLAFGVGIELLQSQLPGRSAEWHDVLADGVGIAGGALLASSALRAAASHEARRR